MSSTPTPLLRLRAIDQGTETNLWGPLLDNGFWEMLEDGICAQASVSVSGGNVTLSTANFAFDQSRCAILKATGTPGAVNSIILPAVLSKVYLLTNDVTTNQAVLFKARPADPGLSLPPGKTLLAYVDLTANNMTEAQTNISLDSVIIGGASTTYAAMTILNWSAGATDTPFRWYYQGGRVIAVLGAHTTTFSTAAWSYNLLGAGFPSTFLPANYVPWTGTVYQNLVPCPAILSLDNAGTFQIDRANAVPWIAGLSRQLPFNWTISWATG